MPPRPKQPTVSIKDLPPGVWRIPPCRWILSLRTHDGLREIRKVRGSLTEARERRTSLMRSGRYSMAWLMEANEDVQSYKKTEKRT